jgi:alpha-mannosidase II
MLAYPLYDIPNTCGPDWDTCAEFDFERPVSKAITDNNIKERATTLLNQYRLKSDNFRHNNVLIPLGDDFKYKTIDMTREIFTSYQRLFDYMNSHPEMEVNIKFATLSEYFDAVHASSETSEEVAFPVYYGDFFTYNDRDQDYWSGYFTTRPFVKALSRQTEGQIKYTESLYSVAKLANTRLDWKQGYNTLNDARKAISLYQHHDGITGTAKGYVSKDYANQLHSNLWKLKDLSREILQSLVFPSAPVVISMAESGQDTFSQPQVNILKVSSTPSKVVLYNPLLRVRTQLIKIVVDNYKVDVFDSNNSPIESAIFPIIKDGVIDPSNFELHFIARTSPLSVQSYFVKTSINTPETTSIYSSKMMNQISPFQIYLDHSMPGGTDTIENDLIKIELQANGMLDSVIYKSDNSQTQLKQEMYVYTTRRSGAYLFAPDGPATPLPSVSLSFIIVKSKFAERVIVDYGNNVVVTATLYQPCKI